jgi:hypothetical protein
MLKMNELLNELALILRGESKNHQGDRRMNAYTFLIRNIGKMSNDVVNTMGKDIIDNVMNYAISFGISPTTLIQISNILLGQRQGVL